MNLEELCLDVFEQLGEPSDLLPGDYDTAGQLVFDETKSGAQKLIDWVNRGYQRILGWKFKDGRLLRFDSLIKELFFKTAVKSGTLGSATDKTATFPAGFSATNDFYNEWVLYISGGTGVGQYRAVVDYVGATLTATVHTAFDTTPDATSTFELYKGFYEIKEPAEEGASDNIVLSDRAKMLTVIKMTDMNDRFDLATKERTEQFSGSYADVGIPSTYWTEGYKIRFDIAPDEERWYKMKYIGMPPTLLTGAEVPMIPANWHEGIVLWATWWGLRRERQWNGAYSTKMDLIDFMETTKRQSDMRGEEENGFLEVVLK